MPNVQIIGLGLYLDSTLVISDLHIGYEEFLNKQGILVPRLQFEEMSKKIVSILKLLEKKAIKRIIVNGDLKHEFGTISEQEWRNTLNFLDLLLKHAKEVVLIKGNHDTIIGPIAKKRNVQVVNHFMIPKKQKKCILIIHGDKIPGKGLLGNCSAVIIGHEHPAISIKEGSKVESYKCFLKGKYKGKTLIVQPSFNTLIDGTDVLREKTLSPLLRQRLDKFDVYAVEDKAYKFGKLKNLFIQLSNQV